MGWKKKIRKVLKGGKKALKIGGKVAEVAAPVVTAISNQRAHSEKSDDQRPTRQADSSSAI